MAELKTFRPGKCKKDRARLVTATSAADLLDWINSRHDFNDDCSSQDRLHPPEQKWDLGAGWGGAVSMVRSGWHDGTADLAARLDLVKHAMREEAHGYKFDVTGRFFDVGLVMSGEPECWLEQDYQPVRKVCRIQANGAYSWDTAADTIRNRGAAIVALADHLQQSGWIVEISLYYVGLGHGDADENSNTVVRVDVATNPIDIDELALLLAHPAGFRRLGFAAEEAANANLNLSGYGGGGVTLHDIKHRADGLTDYATEAMDFFTGGAAAADADVSLMEYVTKRDAETFGTPELAAQWVRAQIERIES